MQLSSFYHTFLYCTTFFLLYIYDKLYNQQRIRYLKASALERSASGRNSLFFLVFIAVSLSVITEGLRYGRGVDQLGVYAPFYIQCNSGHAFFHDFEPLFVWINQGLNKIDPLLNTIPFGSIFLFYALLEWIMILIMYSSYKDETRYFLLFALIATFGIFENFIRQSLSVSFIFAAIGLYNNKKWKWAVLLLIGSLFIHKGNAVFIALLIASYFILRKRPLSIKITIPLFILFEFFVGLDSVFNIIMDVVPKLNISEDAQFSSYLTNADYIQSEISLAEDWQRGPLTQAMTAVRYIALFYLGWYVCKKIPKDSYVYVYNTFIVCALIYEPFRLYGTLSRAFVGGDLLWFVPISLALFNWKQFKGRLFRLSTVYVILFEILIIGRFVFLNPEAKYIWDFLN